MRWEAFLLVPFIWCNFSKLAFSQCNTCMDSGFACVSENEYQVCSNGIANGSITSCPTGQICALLGQICQNPGANAIVACSGCNKCNANNTFACINSRQFALCLGTTNLTEITGSCAEGSFCNIDNPFICGTAAEGLPATCPYTTDPTTTTTTTTTTPSPTTQPNSYCALLAQRGRFPVGIDPNSTCRQYLLCIQNNGLWIGALYTCPNNTYFNEGTRACQRQLPGRCSSRVLSLSIYGMELF